MTLIQFAMPVIEIVLVIVPLLQAFKWAEVRIFELFIIFSFSAFKAATVSRQNKKYSSDVYYIGPAYLGTSILAFDGFKESSLAQIYHLKRIK